MAKRLLLLVGSLVVAVGLTEGVLRVLGLGYGNAHLIPSDVLHHAHERDHRFLSYHPAGIYGGHEVYYDAEGRRAAPGRTTAADASRADRVVAVMGDSFVEALQVAHEDSFVGRLEAATAPGTRVLNYGVSSYSPALYLLQWRQDVRRADPTHVVLMLFGNDVRDDREMTERARTTPDGDLVAIPGAPRSWSERLGRMSYLGRLLRKVQLQREWQARHPEARSAPDVPSERDQPRFVEENPSLSPLTEGYLTQLAREVAASDATLTLLAVPSRVRALAPEAASSSPVFHDAVAAWAAAQGVDFVDLATPFARAGADGPPLFFADDIHFTAEGHRVVAEALQTAHPDRFR